MGIHIFVDKLHKNVVLNKFRITVDTTKDGKEVLNIIADTTKTPYKFKVFAPEIRNRFGLDKITKGDDGIFITVDHELGDHLEVIANLKNWSGMKIVTKGTKKDVFWNGKPVGESEFEVGDKYIMLGGKKKGDGVILKDGDNIKVKLSLEGNNPLKNSHLKVTLSMSHGLEMLPGERQRSILPSTQTLISHLMLTRKTLLAPSARQLEENFTPSNFPKELELWLFLRSPWDKYL